MVTEIVKCALLSCLLWATHVFSTPPPGHVPTPAPVDEHPPKYEYGYIVNDEKQGSTQGHVESRDGIFAVGRYHITLPDGSGQKVTYFADDWGYHPLVTYSSSSEHGSSRTEFAMGDKAVEALKHTGSPVANLIATPQEQHATTIGVTVQPTVLQHVTTGISVQPSASPPQVQIVNVGASGHKDQSQNINDVQSTTVASTTTPVVHQEIVSTTLVPPTQAPIVVTDSTSQAQYSSTQFNEELAKLEEENRNLQYSVQAQQNFLAATPQLPVATNSHDIISHVPNQQYLSSTQQQKQIFSTAQSPLSSILLQETPAQHGIQINNGVYSSSAQNVHIVTPTPISQQPQNFLPSNLPLNDNSIFTNGTDDISTFTVEGNNVQISSYLADTNKVLEFGDRIQAKDRRTEQKLIDQIQQHAKLRILQDLQRTPAVTPAPIVQPIVVTSGSTPTPHTLPSIQSGGSISVVSYNNGEIGYNNVVQVPHATLQPPTGGDALSPSHQQISNAYLESNSLSEKSDYTQLRFGASGSEYINFSPQSYSPVNNLHSLHAGVTYITAEEKPVAPVTEDTNEGTKTVVEVQKGIALELPQEEFQSQTQQYQALGYERRLVDAQAQQVVKEPDLLLREQKKADFAIQQEIELRQVQNSLQELQQKIVNEIDAQHEEEQKKQEAVAHERQKHLDSLQRVSEIIKDIKPVAQAQFQGPGYLPPHPTQETYFQYQGTNNAIVSGESYQQVSISTTTQEQETQQVYLSPPPVPPTIAEIEKPVIIERPVPIETTKIVEIEKPVIIKETVPVETTKYVEVEKTVPVLQPYPLTVPRLVHLERPISAPEPYGVPQPIPYPYAIPQPFEVPFPQLLPYTELLPVPYKQYHPVYISTKTLPYKANGRREIKPSKRMPEPAFKNPKPELFQFSHSYHTIPLHMKSAPQHKSSHYRQYYKSYPVYHLPPLARSRNSLKNLRIEYGGFKPPLVPSTELTEDPKPSPYGPSVKEERR